jgi:hypothetical protein
MLEAEVTPNKNSTSQKLILTTFGTNLFYSGLLWLFCMSNVFGSSALDIIWYGTK